MAEEVVRLSKIIKDKECELALQTKRNSELESAIKRIRRVDDRGKVVEMLNGHVNMDLNRKQVNFEYELDDVEVFLEIEKKRCSQYFFAQNLAWYLDLRAKLEGKDKFLSIYLGTKSYDKSSGDWTIRVTYELAILNPSGGKKKLKSTRDFCSKGHLAWGLHEFISIQDLKTGGYIKDNKIRVQAHLEAGELVRISY